MESNPNNTGNHWIIIATIIAPLIIGLIQPLIQVLLVRWLRKRQRRRSAAKPETNQPSGLKRKSWLSENWVFVVPALIGLSISVFGFITIWLSDDPVTKGMILRVGVLIIIFCFNVFMPIVVYLMDRYQRWFEDTLSLVNRIIEISDSNKEESTVALRKITSLASEIQAAMSNVKFKKVKKDKRSN